jgi:hypothetical protein
VQFTLKNVTIRFHFIRNVASIVDAKIGVQYEFTGERGALVYLVKMRCSYLDPAAIKNIMKDDRVKHMRLVTQIWQTPAYVTYMSDKSEIVIYLSI